MALAVKSKFSLDYSRMLGDLVKEDPFVGSILERLEVESSEIQKENLTLRIDESLMRFKMVYNESQFMRLAYAASTVNKFQVQKYARSILMHEIYHLILDHPVEIDKYANKTVAGMAMDLFINLAIGRENFMPDTFKKDLPSFYSIYYEDIVKFIPDLDSNENVPYYYKALCGLKDELEDKKKSGKGLSEDEEQMLEAMQNTPEKSRAKSKSKAGDGEEGDGEGNDSGDSGNPYDVAGNNDWERDAKIKDEDRKDVMGYLGETIEQLIEGQADKFEQSGMSKGNVGGQVRHKIDTIKQKRKPVVNWRMQLRMFMQNVISDERRGTRAKESRRFENNPGFRSEQTVKLAIAIDTSGSVCNHSLSLFMDEIMKIKSASPQCVIHIVECDTRVTRDYELKKNPADDITGRGGTEFQPAIDFCEEKRMRNIIYFTDGECNPPKLKPGTRILWIVHSHGNYAEKQNFPGKLIRMTDSMK